MIVKITALSGKQILKGIAGYLARVNDYLMEDWHEFIVSRCLPAQLIQINTPLLKEAQFAPGNRQSKHIYIAIRN